MADSYGSIDATGEQQPSTPRRENITFASQPSSPTSYRRAPTSLSRRPSNPDNPDERTSLLTTSRSRIRKHSAHDSPRQPNLSRNQSYAGTNHLPRAQVLLFPSLREARSPLSTLPYHLG